MRDEQGGNERDDLLRSINNINNNDDEDEYGKLFRADPSGGKKHVRMKRAVSNHKPTDGVKTSDIFHGLIPQEDIMSLLNKEGDFLMHARVVEELGKQVSLSVLWNGNVETYGFLCAANNEVTLDNINFKPTMLQVVEFHLNTRTPLGPNGARLLRPSKKQDWELDHNDLIVGKQIGQGAFGRVCKGTLKMYGREIPVAIKMPKLDHKENLKEAMQEARIMRQYNHMNIVRLFGVCFGAAEFMIVLEFVDGGGLDTYLKKKDVSNKLKQAFCFDVAVGLEYLHHQNCLHRDMAARNCLVDTRFPCVKISDFGLSFKGQVQVVDRKKPAPIRWMAPEVLRSGRYDQAADIWSMTVLFWEIITSCREQPYAGMDVAEVRLGLQQTPNFHPEIPPDTSRHLKFILATGWDSNPKLRPSAARFATYMAWMADRKRYPSNSEMDKYIMFKLMTAQKGPGKKEGSMYGKSMNAAIDRRRSDARRQGRKQQPNNMSRFD